ncbi:hypothetical protein Tco_0934623 [Tanacetum coccineum]
MDFKEKTTCFLLDKSKLMLQLNAPTNESSSQALVAQDSLGCYDWSNDFKVEPVNYALMAISSSSSSSSSNSEKVVKEIDELKDKIAKWEESSKNLDEILNSQMSARDKTGLGYSTQLNELSSNHETDSENCFSVFDGRSRLDEYAIRNKIIESQKTELNTKTSETTGKTNDANTEKPKSVNESVVSNPKINRDSVIIEDWNSNDKEEGYEMKTVRPETQTVKTRDDKSGQTSKKQGIGFKKILTLKVKMVWRPNGNYLEHVSKDSGIIHAQRRDLVTGSLLCGDSGFALAHMTATKLS